MKGFQGPALLQYDNAVFEKQDFLSIQKIGDGRKQTDPTRTGKFGLGFNSVYHLTDIPSFISGQYAVFL